MSDPFGDEDAALVADEAVRQAQYAEALAAQGLEAEPEADYDYEADLDDDDDDFDDDDGAWGDAEGTEPDGDGAKTAITVTEAAPTAALLPVPEVEQAVDNPPHKPVTATAVYRDQTHLPAPNALAPGPPHRVAKDETTVLPQDVHGGSKTAMSDSNLFFGTNFEFAMSKLHEDGSLLQKARVAEASADLDQGSGPVEHRTVEIGLGNFIQDDVVMNSLVTMKDRYLINEPHHRGVPHVKRMRHAATAPDIEKEEESMTHNDDADEQHVTADIGVTAQDTVEVVEEVVDPVASTVTDVDVAVNGPAAEATEVVKDSITVAVQEQPVTVVVEQEDGAERAKNVEADTTDVVVAPVEGTLDDWLDGWGQLTTIEKKIALRRLGVVSQAYMDTELDGVYEAALADEQRWAQEKTQLERRINVLEAENVALADEVFDALSGGDHGE